MTTVSLPKKSIAVFAAIGLYAASVPTVFAADKKPQPNWTGLDDGILVAEYCLLLITKVLENGNVLTKCYQKIDNGILDNPPPAK